jgi:glycosyltransferase involved in cell wall biosynthesis
MAANRKVIVIMPAYNATKTLLATYENIDTSIVKEVILVDDASKDKTVEIARDLQLKVIAHPRNVGYGGNQKTCYMEALRDGVGMVIMLHPDGQYDPRLITYLLHKSGILKSKVFSK